MKSPVLLASIGLLAALGGLGAPAHAGDAHRDRDARPRRVEAAGQGEADALGRGDRHDQDGVAGRANSDGAVSGMRPVVVTAGPGEPGHGWRYFSDPVAGIALVISPQGEHFFSRGDGLRLIAVSQPAR